MREMSYNEMQLVFGREPVTLTGILLYVGAAAAITAIIKMCTAGKGKVKLPGISLEWTS
ncbi:MAG: hypothetical protein IKM20_09870 [Erysipelotrichales bacterium]|nr:hypothetical protein [Erysipelotrichales bacterium]